MTLAAPAEAMITRPCLNRGKFRWPALIDLVTKKGRNPPAIRQSLYAQPRRQARDSRLQLHGVPFFLTSEIRQRETPGLARAVGRVTGRAPERGNQSLDLVAGRPRRSRFHRPRPGPLLSLSQSDELAVGDVRRGNNPRGFVPLMVPADVLPYRVVLSCRSTAARRSFRRPPKQNVGRPADGRLVLSAFAQCSNAISPCPQTNGCSADRWGGQRRKMSGSEVRQFRGRDEGVTAVCPTVEPRRRPVPRFGSLARFRASHGRRPPHSARPPRVRAPVGAGLVGP